MNPAAAGGVPYQVPPEPKAWSSTVLALAVHGLLLFFLWFGIRWQNNAPVAVEAEVWDVKTEMAAPPPPPPQPEVKPEPTPPPPPVQKVEEPPAPKPPDIALEREKARKLKEQQIAEQKLAEQKKREEELKKEEQKKLAEEKAAKDKADKLAKEKKAAEEKRLAKLRDDEIKRFTASLGAHGTASKSTAPKSDSGYIASLTAKIKGNIIYGGSRDLPGNPTAIYRITQLPTGEVIGYKKIQSSGVPEYDRAVEQAITASSPLPKKKDGSVERTIEPIFKLKEE
ncbi:cell envelope integrity protein TolA [Massilia arenosa]|uniref:Cell envelope integrity protein TolA n=1 Tax=Zemynaea arenosa TaxID=2561931 RepID=A0A4Y9RR78_9BURK|nr:cell envelope integrity protein TolA [Massilia arenosa]TFW11422.1 cell envelope integrity protein TolA [Massilia arenosa]